MRVVSSWVVVVVVGAWLVRAAVPCRRVEAGRWLEVEVEGDGCGARRLCWMMLLVLCCVVWCCSCEGSK